MCQKIGVNSALWIQTYTNGPIALSKMGQIQTEWLLQTNDFI